MIANQDDLKKSEELINSWLNMGYTDCVLIFYKKNDSEEYICNPEMKQDANNLRNDKSFLGQIYSTYEVIRLFAIYDLEEQKGVVIMQIATAIANGWKPKKRFSDILKGGGD